MGRAVAISSPAQQAVCAHCGIGATGGAVYCCFGCEIAAEIAAEGSDQQRSLKDLLTLSLILSMIVMMFSLFLFAEDVYGAGSELGWMRSFYRFASAVVATPVVFLLGAPLARRAFRELAQFRLSMELLVFTGAIAAYFLSISALISGRGGVYFDSATSALLLATLGRYLEATARATASRQIGPTLSFASEQILTFRDAESAGELMWPADIQPGMRIRVAVGQSVPVDAQLVGESVEVSLSIMTGEATPIILSHGQSVLAGAVPLSNALEAICQRPARDSALEQLSLIAKKLREQPSHLQRVANTFAAWLTPVVWTLAIGSFVFWSRYASAEQALIVSLAVVLAACPCTYGVATPLVLWLALRRALERGVVIRNAVALEELASVRTVAFDKTGTLTMSELEVSEMELHADLSKTLIFSLVLGLERESDHPVARALVRYTSAHHVAPASLAHRQFSIGGVSAMTEEGRRALLGSPAFLRKNGVECDVDERAVLTIDGRVIASFRLHETLRPDALNAIEQLKQAKIASVIVTGDSEQRAALSAKRLGVMAYAGLSPNEKVSVLQTLGSGTAMVGDGVNDAPALAALGPSFAVQTGTSLARGMAQVTLLSDDLSLVPWTIELARRAVSLVHKNLVWSTIYNAVFLALALVGALRPVWAGVSMLASSLFTLAGALRMNRFPGPAQDLR